jgi:hypothetical protein
MAKIENEDKRKVENVKRDRIKGKLQQEKRS